MASKKMSKPIGFDWDKHNQFKNWEKHNIDFREIEEVFLNKKIIFFPDPTHSTKEARLVTCGKTNRDKKLTIIFTIRNNKIRVISARDMSKKERIKYYEK